MQATFHSRRLRNFVSAEARRLGLLQLLDWVRYCYARLISLPKNRRFITQNPSFPVPPANLAFDAYNAVSWDEYSRSGLEVADYLVGLVQAHLGTKKVKILEWGCGPARIIRHLPDLLDQGAEICGSDYNPVSVSWCRENIEGVTFFENALAPPLPLEDNSFDCVYGFSVLTHLSEQMCKEWVSELSRVACDDGLILLSTKSEVQQARLLPLERRALSKGEPVFRGNIYEGKKMYDTILPTSYMKNVLFKGFEIILHMPALESASHHEQDLWIIRNPASR